MNANDEFTGLILLPNWRQSGPTGSSVTFVPQASLPHESTGSWSTVSCCPVMFHDTLLQTWQYMKYFFCFYFYRIIILSFMCVCMCVCFVSFQLLALFDCQSFTISRNIDNTKKSSCKSVFKAVCHIFQLTSPFLPTDLKSFESALR